MSEVQSRGQSTRGRGSFRGGRGGYRGTRGGPKSHTKIEDPDNTPLTEDQGEVGELMAKYGHQLPLLREVCEGWNDVDLIFALQETNGDVAAAVDRITTGSISQWGEVKKKHSKEKGTGASSTDTSARGRGRGGLEGRGRGRGAERGAVRGGRGARAVSQVNGSKPTEKMSKTNEEAAVAATGDWDTPTTTTDTKTNGDAAANASWANEPGRDKLASLETSEPKPAAAAAPSSSSKVGGWASLFAKPTPLPMQAPAHTSTAPPPAQAQPQVPSPMPALEKTLTTTIPAVPVQAAEETTPIPAPVAPITPINATPPPIESVHIDDAPTELPPAADSDTGGDALTPSKDELTSKNLDKLPDISHPVASQTVASTTASTQDPMNPAVPTVAAIRPGMSGFAASALKATTNTGRSASYSRRLMEQQEAVVMPGNHAVDRAAVQFGKMGMSDDDDLDAEEEREDPETRTQLPDDSPAAPRASLPPALPEEKESTEPIAEAPSTQRPAPGLPPALQQVQEPQESVPQQPAAYAADQYRYGQSQKAYDPFTQHTQTQAPTTTEPFSNQVPSQAQGLPGSMQDYSQYYGANARDAYQQYYGAYGQGHENQRSGSSFGTSAQESQSQYATSRQQQGFSQHEAQTSGGNTPNPPAATTGHQAQQSQHSQHSQHLPSQGSHGAYPGYGYPNAYGQQYPQYGASYMGGNMSHRYGANRPMFDDVRRDNDYYGNQYSYGHNQQQYSNNYKSNMYAQPQQQQQQQHQYSHDYSSSPANTAAFGGREGSYGRTGSAQPSESQQSGSAGNNAFGGGMPDPFGRTASGFGQSQGHVSHQGSEEQSKAAGPSPSLQGNRPGSALNNMASQQSGLPHLHSQHSGQGQSQGQGFSGYPQYGGFGNQSHQNTGYGYGSNAAFGGYAGYGGRGWAGNYGSGHN